MSLLNIANEDMTIEITTIGVSGDITIISPASTNSKANNKGIYRGDLIFSVANVKSSDCGNATPGIVATATISPTAEKDKDDNLLVIRVGDKVTDLVTTAATEPNDLPPPPVLPCAITFDVEITDAGQDKVKGQ